MKIKAKYLFPILFLIGVTSCDNDDEIPSTPPVVTTATPTDITTTSATVGGNITDDGNSVVTKSGVVYSSNVSVPTIADNRIESIVTEGKFTASISGLTSGTTYHVRAFATNNLGTSYGEVMNFATGNAAPLAIDIVIDGIIEVGKTVTADFTYSDAENDPQGEATYQWHEATNSDGIDETPIINATEKTFVIEDAQNGKFLRVSVTPKATTGTTTGVEVKSNYTTAVGAETATFEYNNVQVTYGVIISQTTGEKWLDRNLGAGRVAQSVTDYVSYGDMFQWGRLADGHQLVERKGGTDADATGVTGISSTRSAEDVPPTNQFITSTSIRADWRNPQNPNLWQGVKGTNNPCPAGWRIATEAEWAAEGITSIDDAYSKLKLTYTGTRDVVDGAFYSTSDVGYYWSSSIRSEKPNSSVQIIFDPASFSAATNNRGNGYACRCMKD